MFEIKKLSSSKVFKTVVIATGYENPLSDLSCVSSKLQDLHCAQQEEVLFDLLCTNGDEWNRFVAILYDGENLLRSTFHVVSESEIEAEVLQSQKTFFSAHPELLANSVLF
jgi:hypothetical protein